VTPSFESAGWFARHAAIARQFVRIGVIRKAQFRMEFVNQVVMDCAFYATHIMAFEFLYRFTDSIAGWSRAEVRVFLGCLFVGDAFAMVWLGQCWLFGEDLKKGNLDTVRVRPAAPIVLYFFQRFSLEGLTNFAIAASYLAYALFSAGLLASPWTIPLTVWAVLLAFWARTVLTVFYSTSELWVLNSDLSRYAHNFFMEVTDRPIAVFHTRFQQFLSYVVPAAAMTYVPASIVTGRLGALGALAYTAFLAVFGLAVFRLWRASFRRYESGMG